MKARFLFFLLVLSGCPDGFSLTPVENSAEDIYWSAPMSVHDYEKDTDLHNIAISAMSVIETEVFRLGDGLINFTTRSNQSPISRSLDSLEYSYSTLPQVTPVRRFGQFWDALQIRQISLSDGRIATSVVFANSYGITSMMQVRANKLVIFVEDVILDLDSAVMFPLNWGLTSLRNRPTKVKSFGYAADGLGVIRKGLFGTLWFIENEISHFGSDVLFGIKKIQDSLIRHKRKKKYGHLHIYAKMPRPVFEENRVYFEGKGDSVTAGTISDWRDLILGHPDLLPDGIGKPEEPENIPLPQDLPPEVIIEADYSAWKKVPRELKKYVITSEEFKALIDQFAPFPS